MKYLLLMCLALTGCAWGSLPSPRDFVDVHAPATGACPVPGDAKPYERTISWNIKACIIAIPLSILAGWAFKSFRVAVGGVTSSIAAIVVLSFLDTLLAWVAWISGGAIVLALVLLAFWVYSRRKKGLPWLPKPRLPKPRK